MEKYNNQFSLSIKKFFNKHGSKSIKDLHINLKGHAIC